MIPSDREPRASSRVGRYEILARIASGGMATVYLARERNTGGFERDVALKLVHPHLRDVPGFTRDLIEEAKLAAQVRHPHVVVIHDAGIADEGVYLAMEYVEGDTLMGLLRKADEAGAPIPTPIALRVLVDALEGLHAAHELRDDRGELAGLVHRDFSPQNIIVGVDGTTRLSDFGVAKASTRLGQTATGIIKGKIRYMSPEQARGRPLDRRCDIWAAGVIAWELLAKRRLFTGENDVAIALSIVNAEAPSLLDVDPSVPVELAAVVARALAADIDERPATALDLGRALSAAADEIGGLADAREVGAFVQERSRPELVLRRRQIADALASSSAQTPAAVPPRARAGRAPWVIGITAAIAASAGAITLTITSGNEPAPAADAASTLSAFVPAATAVPAPTESAGAKRAPVPSPRTSPDLSSVELRSDAPIARVRIGSRVITVAPAASAVLLPLRREEREIETRADVTAADGRTAGVALTPDATTVEVVFPGAARSPRGRPAPGALPAPTVEPLAPSPYSDRPR
jgi:eukaryotic-like serine/threonine-protein kinase